MRVKCGTCGAENPAGTKYCLNCGTQMDSGSLPKWVPYVAVAAMCVIAVVIVFVFAVSVGIGGSGAASSVSASASSEESPSAYLAAKGGKVAIYKSSSAEPYQISDVGVSDLDSDDKAMLDERPYFDTVEEAQVKVEELREAVEAAKQEAEEQAAREAEEKARAEAEARAKAAEAAAKPVYQLPESGAQPFWGVWIAAFKEVDSAIEYVSEAQSQGFDAAVYETTDWENLNSEHYYVVSLGEFGTRAEAEAVLPRAQSAGYADAYVKYTGSRK